jgi:hypothetical protein
MERTHIAVYVVDVERHGGGRAAWRERLGQLRVTCKGGWKVRGRREEKGRERRRACKSVQAWERRQNDPLYPM